MMFSDGTIAGKQLLWVSLLVLSAGGCRSATAWLPWVEEPIAASQAANEQPLPRSPQNSSEAAQPTQSKSSPTNSPESAILSAADLLVTTTAEGEVIDGWYRPLVASNPSTTAASSYRWQHDALDRLLQQQQVDLEQVLSADNATLRATAAIGLARSQGQSRAPALISIVAAEQFSPALRCAAMETYLKTASVEQAPAQLEQWFTSYADQLPQHAELLLAAADRFPTQLAPHVTSALRSRSGEVRKAALLAISRSPREVPREAIDLIEDPDLAVRIGAIELLGQRPAPAATPLLCAATRDADLSVRLAAVAALARHTDIQARDALLEVLARDGERVRAAAVAALARRNQWHAVQAAADDKSWLVRREVAAACDRWKTSDDRATAYALLEDRSMEVRLQLIETLRRWPLEQAGPLLIVAASQRTFAPSREALQQLEDRWPPATSIGATAGDPTSDSWQQLTAAFASAFGSDGRRLPAPVVPAAVETSKGNSPDRIPAEFRAIGQMSNPELSRRREGASALEQLAADRPLSEAALARLASVAPADNDPLVWRSLITAIGRNRGQHAFRLAYAALSHPDPETRRRACLYLAEHANEEHLAPLAVSLEEQDPRVALAAIKAFAASAIASQLDPLEALVHASNVEIRLAAAVELARKGCSTGHDTLESLAGDPRAAVRRSAVEAMGKLADPLFLPLLMILLEDRYDVRLAALEALPKVASVKLASEQANAQGDVNLRCTAWQQWYARGGSFADRP